MDISDIAFVRLIDVASDGLSGDFFLVVQLGLDWPTEERREVGSSVVQTVVRVYFRCESLKH